MDRHPIIFFLTHILLGRDILTLGKSADRKIPGILDFGFLSLSLSRMHWRESPPLRAVLRVSKHFDAASPAYGPAASSVAGARQPVGLPPRCFDPATLTWLLAPPCRRVWWRAMVVLGMGRESCGPEHGLAEASPASWVPACLQTPPRRPVPSLAIEQY